jgi:hypothetical protein
VATTQNSILAHHHLINRPFGPHLVLTGRIPAGHFFKPKAQDGGCTHCGGNKHTKDTCFQLHGYLERWYELKGKKDKYDHTTFITNTNSNIRVPLKTQPQSTIQDPGLIGSINLVSHDEHVNNWIIDLGATDHMTYDPNDFKIKTIPRR